mmetsp:Transcript_14411/g.23982  ORF Transcript_14411/g.23982 Transcript_14411/m.23982 type:complete len:80 (-) Transcript_14411:12-251(-)
MVYLAAGREATQLAIATEKVNIKVSLLMAHKALMPPLPAVVARPLLTPGHLLEHPSVVGAHDPGTFQVKGSHACPSAQQ